MTLVGERKDKLTHGLPRVDRFFHGHIRLTWVREREVLVVSLEGGDKVDGSQEVLHCAQSWVVLGL